MISIKHLVHKFRIKGEILTSIEHLAHKFRSAIETAINENELNADIVFRCFPNGCCGDTCDLLAQYYLDYGIKTKRVLGSVKNKFTNSRQSHAWLKYHNNVIIDITGDQFKDDPMFLCNCNPVYIGKKNDFYRLFDIEEIDSFKGLSDLDCFSQERLTELYEIVLQFIDR